MLLEDMSRRKLWPKKEESGKTETQSPHCLYSTCCCFCAAACRSFVHLPCQMLCSTLVILISLSYCVIAHILIYEWPSDIYEFALTPIEHATTVGYSLHDTVVFVQSRAARSLPSKCHFFNASLEWTTTISSKTIS